ncbi:hypothetical protein BO83DRAFT_381880 [Aspergillus eucalypticola CBS 122712]|uniref:Uncharacterized protein n=1 Tax=Aspergillus eucalypticola (strain CBS 122712 / IBT 29274) TaxID=1448314 RepID=A0A317URK6_ASPEC|nr:uncharacterized protein BO83DRAFT_381880 [Aspergillus eucalypticola CBS 122712]PWY64653.1 hypothetical protein BO83DRAFT_381880 [Aspergillus eucalypticola CBS 122712]
MVSLALIYLAYFPLPVLLLWVRLGHRSCKLAGLGQGMGVKECKELTGTALDLAFSSGVQKVTHYRDDDEGKDTME